MRRVIVGLGLAVVIATGCGVVPYRAVQRDFEDAVARDNETTVAAAFVDAFVDPSTGYQDVFDTLTPEYIQGSKRKSLKEPRLRPNAWMLRSISAWRLKNYGEATKAAEAGLELQPAAGSRDTVIMQMIPALTRHSEIMDLWVDSGRSFSKEQYEGQRDNMATAWKELSGVKTTEATPESTRYYLYYQQWRLIQNWRQVIEAVEGASDHDQRAMQQWAVTTAFGDVSLRKAAEAVRDKIPEEHPLRKLIVAQGGG